ncbi:MAG: hypothetical protein U1E15_11060 [Hyphomicrobiales bacterium]
MADGTGGQCFAATLEEHNANVQKWRQIENGTAQPPAADPQGTAKPAAVQDTAQTADQTAGQAETEQAQLPDVPDPASCSGCACPCCAAGEHRCRRQDQGCH